MIFPGDIHIILDISGRLKLSPSAVASYDQCGGREVVLHYWPEGSLGILPKQVWEKLCSVKGYDQADSLVDMQSRLAMLRFMRNSKSDEISAQGRLTIPVNLRKSAGLECGREVVLTSNGQYLNVWNPERLAKVMTHLDAVDQQECEEVFPQLRVKSK